MVTDIHPTIVGPHALALIDAKKSALIAWGINPTSLTQYTRKERELMISHEYESINV